MPAPHHPLLGKWRIIEMELWDADFLDLVEPAYIAFDQQGRGEFVFGAVYGSLDCRYGSDNVDFTWQGSDEMDPVCGEGDAELDASGLLTGEIRFHGGDQLTFNPDFPDGLALGQRRAPISDSISNSYAGLGRRVVTDAKGESGKPPFRQRFHGLRVCRPDPNGESGFKARRW